MTPEEMNEFWSCFEIDSNNDDLQPAPEEQEQGENP